MDKVKTIIIPVAVVFCLLGITKSEEIDPPVTEDLEPLRIGIDSRHIKEELAGIQWQFAFLLTNNTIPDHNILFSPLNTYITYALQGVGSRDKVRAAFFVSLGIADRDSMEPINANMRIRLTYFNTNVSANVHVDNAVFFDKNLRVRKDYLEEIKLHYQTQTELLDFSAGGSVAKNVINGWVSKSTNGSIQEALKKEVPSDTKIFFMSTLNFNDFWELPFDIRKTTKQPFNTGVKDILVDTMDMVTVVPYKAFKSRHANSQMIVLPFKNPDFGMIVAIPGVNYSLHSLIETLGTSWYTYFLDRDVGNYHKTLVHCKIPRFKIERTEQMNNLMKSRGSDDFFLLQLELSVEDSDNKYLPQIYQSNKITINELGANAAGVNWSAVSGGNATSNVQFFVNRPFIFSIFNYKTGSTLYSGLVYNPSL